ncbi:MAG TPA: M28 family metallopeptidase [Pyrinomonadaceae bacterium]|nr:M28 family metallopeptidase [Pyrinomonadaceae bacterium]
MNRRVPSFRLSFVSTILLALLLTPPAPRLLAQTSRATRRTGAHAAPTKGAAEVTRGVPTARPQPEIAAMLREIDARNIERTVRKLVSFGTRNTLSAQDDPARGIGAARDWIYQQMQQYSRDSGGRLKVELQSFEQQPGRYQRIQKATRLTNVVATLPGTQAESKDRVYVVSGHYDSMCTSPTDAACDAPGANDDASGTAAVMELARVMSKRQFDATIIFMTVAGEEQGLVGSTYFAEQAKKQRMNVDAMLDNDIIGSSTGASGERDNRTVRVFSEGVPSNETPEEANIRRSVGGENDSQSRQLARFIRETAEKYLPTFRVRMVYRRDRYLRGGDHIPFLENGYAAVRFTEPNENYNHQHQNVRVENGVQFGDLPQFDDFAYIAQVARVNCAALAALALAPARPSNARILTRRLTNDTDLQWDANKEPDLAGYEVVWRDTTEPVWTHSRWVGNVTSYTVAGLSKDNYFFGVRAVDRDGNRSPVSYPRPSRQ